jgi:hypothetical protein
LRDNQGRDPEGSSAALIPLTRGEPAMRRFPAVLVLSMLTIFAIALPASACLNDRDVNAKEREFKSQYHQNTPSVPPEPVYSPPMREKMVPYAALGTGSFLLLGAGLVCLRRK